MTAKRLFFDKHLKKKSYPFWQNFFSQKERRRGDAVFKAYSNNAEYGAISKRGRVVAKSQNFALDDVILKRT
ncbi:5842_t:CDS:2, partial [Gigaspora rosea]